MAGQKLSVSFTSYPTGSWVSAGDISGEGYYIYLRIALSGGNNREVCVEAIRALGAYDAKKVKFLFGRSDALRLISELVARGIGEDYVVKILGGVSHLIATSIAISRTESA